MRKLPIRLSGDTRIPGSTPVAGSLAPQFDNRIEPLPRSTTHLFCILIIASLLLLSGCAASSTGLQTDTPHSELSGLRRMEIKVSGSDQMYLSQSATKGGYVGMFALGIFGAALESGIRSDIDQRKADSLAPAQGRGSMPEKLEHMLIEDLSKSKQFDLVIPSSKGGADVSGTQARILVDLEHWGLYPPVINKNDIPEGYVQVGAEAEVKIIELKSGNTLWSSKELYLHGKNHPISAYQENSDLLREEVNQAIAAVSHRLSIAIRRACR
jgi:hypothetical protein